MADNSTLLEKNVLKAVRVRLVLPEEMDRFNRLLREQHYLHSDKIGGRHLRYVAELDGQWIAILAFSNPALNIKARENWIQWSQRQRARRLNFIVNNSRFLLLTQRHQYPNLASRILGITLRRLNRDWEAHWGHKVLIVESFVDETLYRGTCYRACGFQALGPSSGYGRCSRDFYQHHNQPRQLYLRELIAGGARMLRQARLPAWLRQHEKDIAGPCSLRAAHLNSLLHLFKTLKDQRRGHGLQHRQAFVLACVAVSILMGAGSYKAMEDICSKLTQRQLKALGARYNEKKKAYCHPSDSTFFRVIEDLDAQELDRIIGLWLVRQEIGTLKQLAIDGKTLRGSGRGDGKPLMLLSAVTHRLRLTVGQQAIQEKSNEIPAIVPLLKKIPLAERTLVTADAMHCQQETARLITQELGGEYLIGLKGNQSGILERANLRLPKEFFSL